MFGNPFSKFPSLTQFPNEKCRWCLARLGTEALKSHYPVPVCRPCYLMAYENSNASSPKGDLWHRLNTEFADEARAECKRTRTTPTPLDLMEVSTSAIADVAELKKQIQKASLGRDTQMVTVLEERLKERLDLLSKFRSETPELLSGLGKVS